MPCHLGDDAHVEAVRRVGPAEQVLHEIVAALHVGHHVGAQLVPVSGRHGRIVVPPDRPLGRPAPDDVFVLRRAAGELARRHQECAAQSQRALASRQRRLDEPGLGQIVVHLAQPGDALGLQRLLAVHAIGHVGAPPPRAASRDTPLPLGRATTRCRAGAGAVSAISRIR